MQKILPIFISVGASMVIAILYFIFSNKSNKLKNNSKNLNSNSNIKSAQTFINLIDITNDMIYGADGYKRIILFVEGINIELLNKNEINRIMNELSAELSRINIEFDICGIEQPFNIETLKEEYEDKILNARTDIQRTFLRNSLRQILEFGENGNVVERKFYIIIQGIESEQDLIKQADNVIECFKASKIKCYKLKDIEIKRFINLFNNMSTYNYDNMTETINSIPTIKEDLEKQKTIDEKLKEKEEMEKEKVGGSDNGEEKEAG